MTGEYARIARKLGVRELETVVTAPGRQGDYPERLARRDRARRPAPTSASSRPRTRAGSRSPAPSRARIQARAWSPSATSAAARPRSSSAPSCSGPAWVRSVDLGSLRLTAALLPSDPPTAAEIDAAREAVRSGARRARAAAAGDRARDGRQRPRGRARDRPRVRPRRARGASSRSWRAGRRRESADALGVRPTRARTLLAGALILRRGLAAARAAVHAVARRDPRGRRAPARSPPRRGRLEASSSSDQVALVGEQLGRVLAGQPADLVDLVGRRELTRDGAPCATSERRFGRPRESR